MEEGRASAGKGKDLNKPQPQVNPQVSSLFYRKLRSRNQLSVSLVLKQRGWTS